LLALLALAVAALISGLTLIGVAVEPNSDYISAEPWLVILGSGRIGVEFITYGRDFSAVQYGIVDSRGDWVAGPSPVTGRYGYFLSPTGAVTVSDANARVHIAWTLYDSNLRVQSFRYTQLDGAGRVTVATGPLGNRSVPDQSNGPINPVIRLNTSTVDVVWLDQGTNWAVTVDMNGRVVQAAHPIAGNVSAPPRVPAPLPSTFGSTASTRSDGAGSTYYVWQQSRFRNSGRQGVLEYELRFYRTGPGGAVDRILYSTDDLFWTTKPTVLPGFALTLAGAVAVPLLAAFTAMHWRPRGRP
jgi:hypothetical protein